MSLRCHRVSLGVHVGVNVGVGCFRVNVGVNVGVGCFGVSASIRDSISVSLSVRISKVLGQV